MTQPDLTAIDSETLRGMMADDAAAQERANIKEAARRQAGDELDAIEREYRKHRQVLYHAAVPYCDACNGPCHHGYAYETPEKAAAEYSLDFKRYRELVLALNAPAEVTATQPGALAFAIKRELIRRGEWP